MSTEHVGASESWSPRAELDAAGLSPELRVPTELEAADQLSADLDAVQADIGAALDDVISRALARLERAGVAR